MGSRCKRCKRTVLVLVSAWQNARLGVLGYLLLKNSLDPAQPSDNIRSAKQPLKLNCGTVLKLKNMSAYSLLRYRVHLS